MLSSGNVRRLRVKSFYLNLNCDIRVAESVVYTALS